MTLRVERVTKEFVNRTWPFVEKYLADALTFGDPSPPEMQTYRVEHMRDWVMRGDWALYVAVDENSQIKGAATVLFYNEPLHRIAFVTAIGGRLIIDKNTLAQFDALLIGNGATLIQAMGRDSIVRLWRKFGFSKCNTMVERLL